MASLDPEHLFEQAKRLIEAPAAGRPRQEDLRRAVSNAYYGVFHGILAEAAERIVGKNKRDQPLYSLVYRSVDHRALKELCIEVRKPKASQKYSRYVPAGGFAEPIRIFANGVLEIQEKRNEADYEPWSSLKAADAAIAISTARACYALLRNTQNILWEHWEVFLKLLLFSPR